MGHPKLDLGSRFILILSCVTNNSSSPLRIFLTTQRDAGMITFSLPTKGTPVWLHSRCPLKGRRYEYILVARLAVLSADKTSLRPHNVQKKTEEVQSLNFTCVTDIFSPPLKNSATTQRARRYEYILVARLVVSRVRETSLRLHNVQKKTEEVQSFSSLCLRLEVSTRIAYYIGASYVILLNEVLFDLWGSVTKSLSIPAREQSSLLARRHWIKMARPKSSSFLKQCLRLESNQQ